MKKIAIMLSVFLLASCGSDTQDTKKIKTLEHKVALVIDLQIHNYAPAPLAQVDVQIFLPISLNGFQSLTLNDKENASLDRYESSLSILKFNVGDMAARASSKRQIKIELGYQDKAIPLDIFEPLEMVEKGGLVKNVNDIGDNGAINEFALPNRKSNNALVFGVKQSKTDDVNSEASIISEEEEALIKGLQLLQEKGIKVFVFEGIECEEEEVCHLKKKIVWYEQAPTNTKNKPKEAIVENNKKSNVVKFIYENLTTYEQIHQAFINQKRFVLSSAVIDIQ